MYVCVAGTGTRPACFYLTILKLHCYIKLNYSALKRYCTGHGVVLLSFDPRYRGGALVGLVPGGLVGFVGLPKPTWWQPSSGRFGGDIPGAKLALVGFVKPTWCQIYSGRFCKTDLVPDLFWSVLENRPGPKPTWAKTDLVAKSDLGRLQNNPL
jgi:hypothetical protein